ncbi:hypothetical protein HRbin17_01928 [bacterium HR17]|uniref:Uncharacterized protein n=1 Tax=Candidatus Fervidibacter japonicus TaxID=2035412 RepID=A0A2H5XE07_9BACT|nr:hypothetical protein HRbin17_01928 [bacterium HR17]
MWRLVALLVLFCTVATALEPNLLTNGGLDRDADQDGVADGWVAEVHRAEGGEGRFALDPHDKVQGTTSQHIVHTSAKGWVRVSQDGIPAKPNARYLFRCWVKANCRFLLVVYAFKADGSYTTFVVAEGQGTGDTWRLFDGVVLTPSDARSFKISLVTDSEGEARFDGAELIALERPPYAFVPILSVPIRLDGNLSEAAWRQTEPLTPFLELGSGKVAEPATVAKIAATPTHLLIAFRCDEPSPTAMRLRTPDSDEPAYMDDCVEVYLDPQHTHDGFWQFVVTPKGNKWAQQVAPSRWATVWWLLPRPTQRLITNGWQAATTIGNDFWAAEIAIPFALFGVRPTTGTTIGINLCRSRKTTRIVQNSAFVYLDEKSFQRPEKFPHIVFVAASEGAAFGKPLSSTGTEPLSVGKAKRLLSHAIRRFGESADRQGRDGDALLAKLVPKPQRAVVYRGEVAISRTVAIALPQNASALERTAAELLTDTLRRMGLQVTLTHRFTSANRSAVTSAAQRPTAQTASLVVLTTFDRLPVEWRTSLPTSKLRTFFAQRGDEAYALFVGTGNTQRGARVAGIAQQGTRKAKVLCAPLVLVGASARGVFNGVQTLRQLVWANGYGRDLTLPICEIWDYPDLKLRGWHFVAPLRDELPFAERLLDWLALMKFNTLVIEVDDRFPYERHPDIAHPQALTKSQWRRFLAQARRLGFDVIPQVQTFGHFGYVLNKPAYRHLSEHTAPHPRWGFYAYCPSDPATYKLVFDLFDEVLATFQPKWFHIGHDEITFVPIGVCNRCKATGKTAWQLLADDIRKLYDYLKAKGVERVAMWCDQLEPDRTGGYAPYFTHFAADLIPKDIVQFCWHYDARPTFPWLTRLRDKGFEVVACGWYHAQNVWRFAAESFDRKTLGYCGTTWYGVTGFATAVDLMTAVVLGAQNAWSVDNPPINSAPHPTNIAQDLWALVGERPRWGKGTTQSACVDLTPFVNTSLTQWGKEGVVPDRCAALEQMSDTIRCNGVSFRLVKGAQTPPLCVALSSDVTSHEVAPDLVVVPVNAKTPAIYLLMTTTARPVRTEDLYQRGRTDPRKVATLVVRYADGSEERTDLLFRRHVTEWNDRLGCSHARIAWQGKTQRGYLLTLCAYEWHNPKPDVPIASVLLLSANSAVQPVIVSMTIAQNETPLR